MLKKIRICVPMVTLLPFNMMADPVMIIKPQQGVEYIAPTATGYNVIKLGEDAGITQVIRTSNMTNIISPTEPMTTIIGNETVDPAIMVEE